jgi:curli production assembly/transport component CsgG
MQYLFVLLALGILSSSTPSAVPQDAPPAIIEQQANQVIAEEEVPEITLSSVINETPATLLLTSLPEPENKVRIAVYQLSDKTGQSKAENGAVSTMVSQGSTEMLITALQRSKQFVVLDRIGLQNIMSEQNLVTSNRIKDDPPEIGVITGADYIITGAITEYQVDAGSGGVGLVIAGIGGSQRYAVASCAIDIRLTDVSTGEVVYSESHKAEILGEMIDFQLFSFFGKALIEFETGKGEQQVINLVLRTLIEESVYSIITSGIIN